MPHLVFHKGFTLISDKGMMITKICLMRLITDQNTRLFLVCQAIEASMNSVVQLNLAGHWTIYCY